MKSIRIIASLKWLCLYLLFFCFPCSSHIAAHSLLNSQPLETLVIGDIEPIASTTNEDQLSNLLLSTHYQKIAGISNYLVSEKLDGVQGVWNGKQLITRKGHPILVPGWFTADFPDYSVIGELWLGRGKFEEISSLVRLKDNAGKRSERWKQVKFMIFDLPEHKGSFLERHRFMVEELSQQSRYMEVIPQIRIASIGSLDKELNRVMALGGEGLMLHQKGAYYPPAKSRDIIKLKPYFDDEAYVVGYKPGKGKFSGMMGALIVETQTGVRFSLGSGFTLKQRQSPPAINSVVTFKYFGLTRNGTPRFASFLRVRFPASHSASQQLIEK